MSETGKNTHQKARYVIKVKSIFGYTKKKWRCQEDSLRTMTPWLEGCIKYGSHGFKETDRLIIRREWKQLIMKTMKKLKEKFS